MFSSVEAIFPSDGFVALVGFLVAGIALLFVFLRSARKCKPIAPLLAPALFWHLIIFCYIAFWLVPFYGNGSDTVLYHSTGIDIANMIRSGNWGLLDWGLNTKAMDLITGFLYAIFGADIYGIFFLSAVLGFGTAIYMCRAFELWVAPAQAKTYSKIILFLPSFAVWTSIFGKDSWIALGLGLSSFGYSRMQKSVYGNGIWHFLGGFLIIIVVRPHIALAIAMAMAMAYLWALIQSRRGSFVTKTVRVVLLLGMVAGLYPLTLNFVGLSGDSSANAVEEYMRTNGKNNATDIGSSKVDVQVAPGIGGAIRAFPRAVVRLLLEPFPWEVNNVNSGLAAVENIFIGFVLLHHLRHPRRLIRQLARTPYFLYSGFATLVLMALFSFLPNLGLISRQRAQMLPFLFAALVAADVRQRRALHRVIPQVVPVSPYLGQRAAV